METGIWIFIVVMTVAAAAEMFLSLYYRPERVIIIPVTRELHIDGSAAADIFGVSAATKVYLVNMGADPAEWKTLEAMAEDSRNVFCIEESDILTCL